MTMRKIYRPSLWFQLILASVVGILVYNAFAYTEDAEEWMPDPALREAVRENLGIPDTIPIHPADMKGLDALIAEHDIQRLKGLEHAVNLRGLTIDRSEISDLAPLAGLENLQVLRLNYNRITDISPLSGLVNLQRLQLHNNQIVDISPLAGLIELRDLRMKSNEVVDITPLSGLVNLQYLEIQDNQISDVTPLQGLVNLEVLSLAENQISDITPLQGLVNLEVLSLEGNPITDFTPLYGLPRVTVGLGGIPIDLETLQRLNPIYRIVCDIAREPIRPRIENRTYPSIFQITCPDIINRPELSGADQIAYDLFSCNVNFGQEWFQTPDGVVLRLGEASREIKGIRNRRPNILLLSDIGFHGAGVDEYPEDSPYYFRDKSGNRIIETRWGTVALLDFRHPDVQKRFIQQAREIAKCGLFDGISIDKWASTGHGNMPRDEHVAAKDRMIQGIRDAVDDDFLILVTTGNEITPTRHHAEYINGFFMETAAEDYEVGYTHAELAHIENTLSWAEENLREPQINCLAGRGVRNELLDSPRNLQWMRLWTTMSLTHSDGYVVFVMGGGPGHPPHPFEFWPGHADLHAQGIRHGHQNTHYHYDFWDADLGRPVGGDETKAQLYENREGLFIREFTNGWAVYNWSGTAQEIELPQEVSGWSSGVENQRRHTLADLDGEIYLKAETPPTADVNGDGTVNVLDLVIVANAFGEAEPDLNGDGVVNIQDLVIVANAF